MLLHPVIAESGFAGLGAAVSGSTVADDVPAPTRVCADLPLSCPLPEMALWNSHPRVYLPIEAEGGESQCPYCGAHFVLID